MIHDFSFSWDGAGAPDGVWAHMQVTRFEGREEISGLYHYEITLLAKVPAPEVDPDDLVGKSATLRIATQSVPELKVVHGIIVEARELTQIPDGLFYRVVLAPPWARAQHRKRSRIFLDKTLRQIIEAVLTGDPMMKPLPSGTVEPDDGAPVFQPADERFTWRIKDASRLDDRTARPFCVQYGESDQAFVARLLEEEGIAYHFESGLGVCLLVLSDTDSGKTRLADAVVGPGVDGREISVFRLGARMRTTKVTLDDYNWKKPKLPMLASAKLDGPGADLTEYAYPGGYPENAKQGEPLATARTERHGAEADHASAEGYLRVLSAGTICKLSHPKPRYEGEHLVTALVLRGEQPGVASQPGVELDNVPFRVRFECARRGKGDSVAESRFRPARVTSRPRIIGSQTAVVTADPANQGAEVNVGGPAGLSIGCVRVRFHWDDDKARHAKEPTSSWIRVSQIFAGAGEGAVWHPRVGVEVIVEFEEGDPDRPLVTGRVYNAKNLPHHGGAPTLSTFKSYATPGGAVWNEMTFDDTAGKELYFMNAGKDMTSNVGNDRSETVAAYAQMNVGVDNTETVGVNCDTSVGIDDTMDIGANQSKTIGANRTRTIGANRSKIVGANETRTIGATQTITVGASLTETALGAVTETYGATRTTSVAAAVTETHCATRDVTVGGSVTQTYGALQSIKVGGARDITVNGFQGTLVAGNVTNTYGGSLTTTIGGLQLALVGGGITHQTPAHKVSTPFELYIDALKFEMYGVKAAAYAVDLSIAGVSASAVGLKLDQGTSLKLELEAAKFETSGPDIQRTALKLRLGAVRVTTCAIFIFI